MAMPYTGAMPPNPFAPQQPDFGGMQSLAPQPAPLSLPMGKIKKGGMFGNTDWTSAISAALNGYLAAGGNPAGIAGLQQLHQRKMMEQEQAMQAEEYARNRQDKRDDFTFEQDYKLAHPGTPDIVERVAALNGLRPGLGDTYAQNYANNGGGLGTIFKDPATGQSYAINPQAAGGPQPGAVEDGYRFKGGNPSDPSAWEPVGGAGGNVSGNFPG